MIFAFGIYYIIGVLILWGLALYARSQEPNPLIKECYEIKYATLMINALVWPLVLIGAML